MPAPSPNKNAMPLAPYGNRINGANSSREGSLSSWRERDRDSTAAAPAPRKNRLRRRLTICGYLTLPCWLILLVCLVVILGISLGVGLGVGLHKSPGDVALAGTGLVSIDFANGSKSFDTFFMIPDKRVVRENYNEGLWNGTTQTIDVITQNAKPGTPLMALSYTFQGASSWRVLFVDTNDTLQEAQSDNGSPNWLLGKLGESGYKFHQDGIGLTACVNYNYYGTPDFGLGIKLYYSAAEGGIRELTWQYGAAAEFWQHTFTFPNSSANGCECVVRGTSITTVWLQNNDGDLQQWWYDFDTSTNTSTHPAQTWTPGLKTAGPRTGSAIGAIQVNETRYVHYQDGNGTVWELEAQGNAENTTFVNSLNVATALLGTKLSTLVLNTTYYQSTTHTGQEIHVFYQSPNHTIMDNIRATDSDRWTSQAVPIHV